MEGDNLDGSNNSTLASGDPVASVVNLGTLGGTFAQGTGSAQPLFSLTAGPGGSKAALTFDGSDFLTSSLAASSWTFLHDGTGATIYTVTRTSVSALANIVATSSGLATSRGVCHRYGTTFRVAYLMNDGAVQQVAIVSANNTFTAGNFNLSSSEMAMAAADIRLNAGASLATMVPGGVSALDAASTLVIGAGAGGASPLNGILRRVLIYQGVHDATLRAAVLAYSQALDAVTYPAP